MQDPTPAPVTPPPTAPVAIPELPAAVAVALNERPRGSSRESALPRCRAIVKPYLPTACMQDPTPAPTTPPPEAPVALAAVALNEQPRYSSRRSAGSTLIFASWTGLAYWTGLDWTGLGWTGLYRAGLDWKAAAAAGTSRLYCRATFGIDHHSLGCDSYLVVIAPL